MRIRPIDSPEAAGIGFGSVWIVSHRGGVLVRIDPRTNAMTEISLDAWRVHNIIAFAQDSLWVMRWPTPNVPPEYLRIDPETNRITGAVPVGGRAAYGGGFLWVYDDTRLIQIDPASATIVHQIRVTDPDPETGIAFARGSVWIATSMNGLLRVDPSTRKVIATIAVPAWKVASDGQDIWTIDEAEGTITRIDPIRNAVGPTVDTQGGILPRVANGLVWVVGHERLVIVDSATAQIVGEYALTGEVGYVDVGFGSVWIPRFDGNEVWRIDYPLPS